MARKQVSSPLEGAAPVLQPTARPLAIQIGATPPPSSSPLMELAHAFREVNPELRDMLRDSAAKADKDAMALGEIEATKARAEGRLAEIDNILKAKVDAGELSRVHLPAAHRGASFRSGKEAAEIGFQTDLMQNLSVAIKEGPQSTEKILSEAHKKFAEAIPSDDFYARQGFDHASQAVISDFRQRVAQGQAAEFDRVSKQKMADEGTELAYHLATADGDAAPVAKASLLAHLDQLRGEMPKSEVNGFYVQNVIAPTIDKLANERKFAEARQLLDEADALDVTGKGGLLGQTAVAKAAFSQLREKIERESRADSHITLDNYKADRELRLLRGTDEAGAQLQKVRLEAGGKLNPADRFKIIDAYRAAHADDPLAVSGFAEAVNREFENEDKFRANERAISDVLVGLNTISKDKLDIEEAKINALYQSGEFPAAARTQALELISQRRALYGLIDEGDFKNFKKDVFTKPGSLLPSVNFGNDVANDLWEKLTPESQNNLELSATEFFKSQLEQLIVSESGGDPTKAPAVKALALDKATMKAREFARQALPVALKEQGNLDTQAKVTAQAANIKQATVSIPSQGLWSHLMGNLNEGSIRADYKVTEKVAKGIKDAPSKTYTFVPRAGDDLEKAVAAQKTTPQSEWDVVATPDYFYYTRQAQEIRGIPRVLDMAELAKEVLSTGDRSTAGAGNPERVAAARQFYGIAKSILGFTPEEIKASKTKHGVPFVSAEIDYKSIPVFRNVAELEKNWNGGDFTPLFGEVGDSLDPKDTMHPEDFYKAQLALLSARR